MYRATGVEPTKLMARTSGCSQERVDTGFAADDEVADAGRQAGLMQQLEEQARRQRHALGGLEDEGVSRCDRVGKEPQRNHGGKVERGNRDGDAERLANHHLVDSAGDVFEIVALHQGGMPHATSTFSMPRCNSA